MANKVTMSICGQEYTLVADESAEYMKKVGALVDQRMDRIQETLHVSANTAKTHIRHIYQKLDVHNRQDLITLAQGAPV